MVSSLAGLLQPPYKEVFLLLGLFYASKLSIKTIWALYRALRTYAWTRIIREPDLVKCYGRWAVVTGSTDGIGKCYAHELARRGLNIILISRSLDKLLATAKDLEERYDVNTHIIQADFTQGRFIYPKIAEEIKGKEIGILVNNVGVMYEYPMEFEEVTEQVIWSHIHLNVCAITMMTHIVLPHMVARGKGAIINLSSSSAIRPLPLMAVYSATKAFVDFFSRALGQEYSSKGIVVQTLVPFYIVTAMTRFSSDLQKPGCLVPAPMSFVRSALSIVGHSNHTTGYWVHGLLYTFCNSVPNWFWMHGSYILHRILIRKMKRQRKLHSAAPVLSGATS